MASRIYVAGHGGLIGSALVRMLRARGCRNVITRSRGELDLSDAVSVTRFFEDQHPDYVLLAAGRVGGIVANRDRPADFLTQNLAIQSNVIGAAHRAGVQRLIFFASSCMYPRDAAQPMAESTLFSGRPEETSMAYAIAKVAGTQLCLAYNQQHGGKRFVPLIPNSVYGPCDNFDPASGHVLAALMARFHAAKAEGAGSVTLWGSGKPRREFLYADDLAEACWLLLQADLSSVDLPINIGPGTDTSVRELASTIADTVGYAGRVEWDASMPDGAPRKLLDSSRMKKLGWQAQVPLAEGVRRTYDWYREHA
ncbi:MAG TPA: GDP-L-fucose synthase [Burkholderiales bacterium]